MDNNWNPRYVLFAAHEGRLPQQQADYDQGRWPGGCMTGFILWIQEHAGKFKRAHPEHCVGGHVANHDAFDEFLRATVKPVDTMVRVDGKAFRCECGCNVFHRVGQEEYVCNSCNSTYTSVPA